MMAEPERLTGKIKYKTNQGQRSSTGIQPDKILNLMLFHTTSVFNTIWIVTSSVSQQPKPYQ